MGVSDMGQSYESDVLRAYKANPDATPEEVAREVGCSVRTVKRHEPPREEKYS